MQKKIFMYGAALLLTFVFVGCQAGTAPASTSREPERLVPAVPSSKGPSAPPSSKGPSGPPPGSAAVKK